MTIPKLTPYTGQVANPDGSQTQTEFTQNMFDQLSYEAQLATQLDATIDGMNNAVDEVEANAVSAENSANAAEAAAASAGYQGLWPDTGGSALKGEIWQTQVSGTPTGEYYTALQNTSIDPVGDNVNWKVSGTIGKSNIGDYSTLNFSNVEDMMLGKLRGGENVTFKEGQALNTGKTFWITSSSVSAIQLTGGLYAHPVYKIYLTDFSVVSGVDAKIEMQTAQDLSEQFKIPVDITGISELAFSGYIEFQGWVEWHGSGRYNETMMPIDKLRSTVGAINWFQKKDSTADLKHFLMQDFGFNGGYQGPSSPSIDQLVSMFRVESNGSNDEDITYLRLHFKNSAHEAAVHNVTTTATGVSSGGTIDGIRMLFCSGDVDDLTIASRNANMFKTIHGEIDQPGAYGEYPITNVISFGNTCRGMRTLSDFKRGTRHFSHDNSTVIDMTDVASISVDGVKDGVIGANNAGYQTASAVDTKNFYEIQGEDIEVLGGGWDADNEAGAVAAVLITDYAYPAEVTGSYNANQSVNVNLRSFKAENITGHAVRYINTKDCSVESVKAKNCTLDAVSFEYQAKFDINGNTLVCSGNSADKIKSNNCRFTVSNNASNPTSYGESLRNEHDQYDIENPSAGVFDFNAENLNANPLVVDYQGGTSPYLWRSGTASYLVASGFMGAPTSFTLEDTNPSSIQDLQYEGLIPMIENEVLYFKLWVKQGTSSKASILVKEFDSLDALVATNFIPLTLNTEFSEQAKRFKCTNSNTTYVTMSLAPAANFGGDATLTGNTHFANVRFGRKPF